MDDCVIAGSICGPHTPAQLTSKTQRAKRTEILERVLNVCIFLHEHTQSYTEGERGKQTQRHTVHTLKDKFRHTQIHRHTLRETQSNMRTRKTIHTQTHKHTSRCHS